MTTPVTDTWETSLVELLEELTDVQDELLEVLRQKRQQMASADAAGMETLQQREEQLGQRLQECHQRRETMLDEARNAGLPGENLRRLATAIDKENTGGLRKQVKESTARMRLLQHESLTNWVLAQRSLLHVSQMLEILATGGRFQPTYGKESAAHRRGALMDREA